MFDMSEQEKNILEKYSQGSISEEEYNTLKQMLVEGDDAEILRMIDECYERDASVYTIPPDVYCFLY